MEYEGEQPLKMTSFSGYASNKDNQKTLLNDPLKIVKSFRY